MVLNDVDREIVKQRVHHNYWDHNINCAQTTLMCLGELLHTAICEQTLQSAVGMHGAGCYRAQCGLVEGVLMFIGVYFAQKQKSDDEISEICYRFAQAYEQRYLSLRCYDLRPGGFMPDDPPHRCESLTVDSICFAHQFIQSL